MLSTAENELTPEAFCTSFRMRHAQRADPTGNRVCVRGEQSYRNIDPNGLDYLDCLANCIREHEFYNWIVVTSSVRFAHPKANQRPGTVPDKEHLDMETIEKSHWIYDKRRNDRRQGQLRRFSR